ncbi:MAG: hypothetical protein ACYDCK_06110 [Thermoplasmatota archaeon]
MAVPAYAAASQIIVPALPEQVVEGHTVFAVIQKQVERNTTQEAAAVAVLVRETISHNNRFNGTLWFNDQFLVPPSNTHSQDTRYPCGGAVLAVNSGDPDPRNMLVSLGGTDVISGMSQPGDIPATGTLSPSGEAGGSGAGGPGPAGLGVTNAGTFATPATGQPGPQSWLDISPDPTSAVNVTALTTNPSGAAANLSAALTASTISSNAPLTSLVDYNQSYLITDPNDHSWIIDKYDGIIVTQVGLASAGVTNTAYQFPIWVVNLLGKPVFTPDDGITSCSPFVDDPMHQAVINTAFARADTAVCGATAPGGPLPPTCPSAGPGLGQDPNGDGVPTDGLDAKPPALGYYEATDANSTSGQPSYCYEGNPNTEGRVSGSGCDHGLTFIPPGPGADVFGIGAIDPVNRNINHPLRLYNALLWFYLTGSGACGPYGYNCGGDPHLTPHDVLVTSRAPHGIADTNGCQVGTEWVCPGNNDNAEGNSHPFNPPGVYVPTVFDPTGTVAPTGTPITGTGSWYDVQDLVQGRVCSSGTDPNTGKCNAGEHVAHNRGQIDLYFSGLARPLEPPVRNFDTLDYTGSMDPFLENDGSNPSPYGPSPTFPGSSNTGFS